MVNIGGLYVRYPPHMVTGNDGPRQITIQQTLDFIVANQDAKCHEFEPLTPAFVQQLKTNRLGWGQWDSKDYDSPALTQSDVGIIIVHADDNEFFSNAATYVTVGTANGGTNVYSGNGYRVFILLEELGHLISAKGFQNGQPEVNNQLVLDHCGGVIQAAEQTSGVAVSQTDWAARHLDPKGGYWADTVRPDWQPTKLSLEQMVKIASYIHGGFAHEGFPNGEINEHMPVGNTGPRQEVLIKTLDYIISHQDDACRAWLPLSPSLIFQLKTNRLGWGEYESTSDAFSEVFIGYIIVRWGKEPSFYSNDSANPAKGFPVGDPPKRVPEGNEYDVLALLHELAHLTNAPSFVYDGGSPEKSQHNNQVVIDHCRNLIVRAKYEPPFNTEAK